MKSKLILLFGLTLFSLSACKKDNTTPETSTPATSNPFSLKHDDILFTTYNPNVTLNEFMIGITAGTIGETGNFYQLGIKRNIQPGTYEYTGSTDDPIVFLIISDQLVFTEEHGSLTVLSNDTILKKIVFNFEFEMLENNSHSDTIQITEGFGNIDY
ncbi:MAG: hypothetical protein K0S23_3131 [Fluviicola sp.]|jgi:hypothetical protein|uniref:hypothetical protein n=1 Tax=Fluviicola sp. TaxID=1917219 RepID=UPI0026091790|nr:hypothetical protein [Fluviicola sp.]MDF3028824.1 hypothetical protein [Fluviicola sp.]